MPEKKKKTAGLKSQEKAPAAGAAVNAQEPGRAGAHLATPQVTQLGAFEAAMKRFHARNFAEARELFAIAAQGSQRDVAQRARLHIAMCDRRLDQPAVNLRSAEDYYNYGVALLNARDVAGAREKLQAALEIAPGAEHVHYALGVAQALAGDYAAAAGNLRRAIELEPRNRLTARQDPDLAPFINQPPFDSLFSGEKKAW